MLKKHSWRWWALVSAIILSLCCSGFLMIFCPMGVAGKVLPGFTNPRWISNLSSIVFETVTGSDKYDLRKEKLVPLTSLSQIVSVQSPDFSLTNVLNPVCYIAGQPSNSIGIEVDKALVQRLKRQPEIASAQIIWRFMDNQIKVGKLPPQARQIADLDSHPESIKGISTGIHALLQHRVFREMPVKSKIEFLDELLRVIQAIREEYQALWEVTDSGTVPDEFGSMQETWLQEQQDYSNDQIIMAAREAGFDLWNEISTLLSDLETTLDELSIQGAQMYITGVDYQRFPSVSTYVSLVDALNRPLDSPAGDAAFQVWDGERRALIVETLRMDNPHINSHSHTVLVIDASGSMNGVPIEQAKKAASSYINMSGSQETFDILKFSSRIDELITSSQDKEKLNATIDSIQTGGQTALYDALVRAVDMVSDVEGRKAVLVLSDGANNTGNHTISDVMNLATKAGVSVYSIAVGQTAEHKVLSSLSEQTGGRCYYTADTSTLQEIYMEINKMFLNQYKINYIVADREKKVRPLKIKLYAGDRIISSETTYMPDSSFMGSRWTK
ncbi:MAG: VWA domain-containing protein [Syntrophomonas sp.]|nr:VWA domain-containing protein [Syntrophomonas sp.]